ncbi:MAG: hypothetical protein G8D86_04575 [gamma proteobacterium symbiont of Ctena orbiculata]
MSKLATEHREYLAASRKTEEEVVEILSSMQTSRISSLRPDRWIVLGFREQHQDTRKPRVVLSNDSTPRIAVWATQGLARILSNCKEFFEKRVDDGRCKTTYWMPALEHNTLVRGLEIEVQPSKKFFGREGMEVCWNPIQVLHAPGNLRVETLQRLAESEAEFVEKASCVRRVDIAPKSTDLWKAVDMLPGEYLCRRFCSQMFRGNPRMLLYVVPLDEGGEPTTDVECPTYGYFLEKEIERLGGPAELEKMRSPILCRFGAEKTTPTKRKDRTVSIASTLAV